MKNNITFLITSLNGGGAQGVCVNVVNGLVEKGWNVTLIVLHLNNSVFHTRLDKRVNLVVLGVNNVRYAFSPLRKYIKDNNTDKIVIFNYELTVLSVLIRYTIKNKFKIIARNINTLSFKKKLVKSFWEKYIVMPLIDKFYLKADYIINQCEGMKKDLISIFDTIENKTGVIYNPVNKLVENASFEKEYKKEDYILCVGRLEKQKAFHYAINAFKEVNKRYPNIRLKIVGEGKLQNDLENLCKEKNIEDKVDFEGFKKDIIPYYKKAKLTLLTSLYEGFPNVLVESITIGTPLVSFDCPSGPNEIIINGENGFLVDYLDETDLINKINYCLDKSFDINSIQKTSKRFKLSNIILNYEELIKNKNNKFY